jgi:glycosyltransferase involved in cell wall biosynthesis
MARAAAVVVPIQWPEPFGMVMAEANACGTPVVAFDTGAAAEVISHGKTGFVVPPGDLEAFCAAIDRTKELLPEDCRAHAAARFSVQRMVADYEKVYEAVSTIDLRTPNRLPHPDPAVVVAERGRPVP